MEEEKGKKTIFGKFKVKKENSLNPLSEMSQISQITEEDFTKNNPENNNLQEETENNLLNKLNMKKFFTTKKSSTHSDDSLGFTKTLNSTGPKYSINGNVQVIKKKLPIIGSYPVKTQYLIALSLLTASTIGLLFGFYQNISNSTKLNFLQTNIVGLLGDSQALNTASTQAVVGKLGAFESVAKNKNSIEIRVKNIKNTIENLSGKNDKNLIKIDSYWQDISKNIATIEKSKDFLSGSSIRAEQISKQTKNLTDLAQTVAFIYYQVGASQNDFNNIFYIRDSLTRINNTITQSLLSDRVSADLISSLKNDRDGIKSALIELRWGSSESSVSQMKNSAAISSFNKLGFEWLKYSEIIDSIYSQSNDLIRAKSTVNNLNYTIESLTTDLNLILDDYDKNFNKNNSSIIIYLFAFLLFLSLLVIVYIYLYEKENSVLLDKIENQKSNMAVLRLLDEMSGLSQGDLTKKVTVTEDVTGAVADAINLTIEDLSSLVRKIKTSVYHMKQKTDYTNELSNSMLNLSELQAQRIEQTGERVLSIADAIGKISYQTTDGANVATQTVAASNTGEKAVVQSLQAMDSIKNQMNETIRLMKRLTDSSKQISAIVDLLSDITEETSVLALNATIQAAKAGEAGKSFKIVADSVQSLANKAADATRKVGALVIATQTDIEEMVDSVKKTNYEVEKGTKLSSEAELSLGEINKISKKMLEIIKTISLDAQEHARLATNVSDSIREILVTNKSSQETNAKTALSVKEINKISDDLNTGIKGFTID